MATIFLAVVGVCSLIALSDWRFGIVAALMLDCLRDPIRKMTPGQPTMLTFCICAIWAAIFANLYISRHPGLVQALGRFPWLKRSVVLYLAALLPGAALSLALYQNGYLIAGLGVASYAAPLLGIAIGICLAGELKFLERVLAVYLICNCVALVGTIPEFLRWDWPGLGGLEGFEWIRHMPGVQVRLISGFFRSPDIAGFHAANVFMVAMILLLNRRNKPLQRFQINPVWLMGAIWSAVPLILCGRRKMLAIPVVFFLSYLVFLHLNAKQSVGRIIGYVSLFLLVTVVALAFYRDDDALADHQVYLATTVTDAVPRFSGNLIGGVATTVRQSGVMGDGIGVSTQGAQHLAGSFSSARAWQEDGVSRVFKELGIPGAVLILSAGFVFIRGTRRELMRPRPIRVIELQGLFFALFSANVASFLISHQHISGDPPNALWILMFMGLFIGTLAQPLRRA